MEHAHSNSIIYPESLVVGCQPKRSHLGESSKDSEVTIIDALQAGNEYEALKYIKAKAAINEMKAGTYPLHESVGCINSTITLELLEAGADVNATNKYGETALHLAVRFNNLEAVKLLLKHGASTKAMTRGRSASASPSGP